MFDPLSDDLLPKQEERVLERWQREKIFERSVEQREGCPLFSFYDGPPFATGLPHYGHLLAGTIKDLVLRYQTMKGYYVPRRFGWDCHGLPVENEIEKQFDLKGAAAIEAFGIKAFNEECRAIVQRYTSQWKETVYRMGRFIDFDGGFKTMDPSFMESVWWVFSELYKQGLIYQGYKVMPYSAKLGTALSNFEAGENYKDVDDPALTVAFKIEPNTYMLAWTTTPWTLISNLALMVHPEVVYVKVLYQENYYILAESRLPLYFKEDFTVVERFLGKELVGKRYEPLFDYFKEEYSRGAFTVISEDSVSTEEGTGVVHAAPAFGEVDFYACKRAGISHVAPVDSNGQFDAQIPEYQGQFVKSADKDIIHRLKEKKALFVQATIRHRYPYCWRSDTPLIYLARSSWFVAVEKIKDKLLKANDQIHWVPGHIKEGRFGKWLEGARDWSISRSRYWGTPIPLWQSEEGDIKVIGSIKELEALTGQTVSDLHRHYIDDLTFAIDGKVFKRIPDVFDCWFESGSMPYAQHHYPFENKELFEQGFPADFIAEGADQTRGWFYTLTILAAALFDKPAFKHVIVNGLVLAEDGNKMSKRLKNYPEPRAIVDKYGADAVRLFLINSPAVRGGDLRFAEKGVETLFRQVLIPLWNAYSFFITYALIYKWEPKEIAAETLIDRWVISRLHKLIEEVEEGMARYELHLAVPPLIAFIEDLTNWYIRRSRERFWQDEDTKDRQAGFATLYTVLTTLSKVIAPFIPFIADMIFYNLKKSSVHLEDFPNFEGTLRDIPLEKGMEAVQKIVSLGHHLRKESKVKVRQPLQKIFVATEDLELQQFLREHEALILDELNIKELCFEKEEALVTLKVKANFRVLGKKVGGKMKEVTKVIAELSFEEIQRFLNQGSCLITVDNEQFLLTEEDLEVVRLVKEGLFAAHEAGITALLDTTLTPALLAEGIVREIRNKVNILRKEQGLAVTDRIILTLGVDAEVMEAVRTHLAYLQHEVLATEVRFAPNSGESIDLNGHAATMGVEKV